MMPSSWQNSKRKIEDRTLGVGLMLPHEAFQSWYGSHEVDLGWLVASI